MWIGCPDSEYQRDQEANKNRHRKSQGTFSKLTLSRHTVATRLHRGFASRKL
jgi:hypothetical protein